MKAPPDRKRSIGEAAKEIGVPEHVLRFWEKEFHDFVQPTIGFGKRRYYYGKDINILLIIKEYLYEKGFTIKGLNNLLKNNGISTLREKSPTEFNYRKDGSSGKNTTKLPFDEEIKRDLKKLKGKMSDCYDMLKNV